MVENTEATAPSTPVSTVTDRRPVPRGVLPRNVQTWLMAGLAVGMLAIMLLVGRPAPTARQSTTSSPAQAPNAERVRSYQDRLRLLEAQATQQAQAEPVQDAPLATDYGEPQSPPPQDSLEADRKRREYESLFASNVVMSRRADNDRPDAGRQQTSPVGTRGEALPPSVDDVADAVVRATTRSAAALQQPQSATTSPGPLAGPADPARTEAPASRVPDYTPPIAAAGPMHRVLEGTVIDAVLTNRLDGSSAAPVNCLVTNPLYSHSGRLVLIPAGARVLGETKPVQAYGETRLAVGFHRLLMPDGRTYRLDQFVGLNQIGDLGLRDRVNQHYLSTFGAAAAVGLISGLSQYLGSAGLGRGDGDRTVVIAGGVGDATSQATMQVMNRFLNRLPSITIREGHRVKVYLTSDLELPAYADVSLSNQF
jgi:type IV secretion system protein VirB10